MGNSKSKCPVICTTSYNDISLVFSTCVEYSSIWNGFFKLFKRNFSFWNGPIYSTVSEDFFVDGYKVIGNKYKGKDDSFSTRLIKTLKKIKTRYVLFFLDDFYLVGPSDKELFDNAYYEITSNRKIKHIILKDFVKHETRCNKKYNNFFHIMKKNAQYKATTQVSIYNRKYFLSLLRKGENAWDFEFFGSFRAQHKKSIVLYRDDSKHNCIKYYDAGLLHRGHIQQIYKPYLAELGIVVAEPSVDLNNHDTNNLLSLFYRTIYPYLSLFFPFIKKHFEGYPSFIYSINHIDKKYYLE